MHEIAAQHGVEISLDDANLRQRAGTAAAAGYGPGARFTLRFPATLVVAQESEASPAQALPGTLTSSSAA